MSRILLLSFCLLGLVFAAFSALRPAWATDIGLDLWNLPALERHLAVQERLGVDLDRQDAIVLNRIGAKGQVIRDLLAERLTLREAAALFRRLNTEPPEVPGMPPDHFPGRTESERYCRQVLVWVQAEMRDDAPSHLEEVRCRLESELDAHLALHDGEVELPEV